MRIIRTRRCWIYPPTAAYPTGLMPGPRQIILATPSIRLDRLDFSTFYPSTWTTFFSLCCGTRASWPRCITSPGKEKIRVLSTQRCRWLIREREKPEKPLGEITSLNCVYVYVPHYTSLSIYSQKNISTSFPFTWLLFKRWLRPYSHETFWHTILR